MIQAIRPPPRLYLGRPGLQRKSQRRAQSAVLTVGEPDTPAERFRDLACECQAETRATRLGGIERLSSATLKRALDLALELSESERAALAHDLLASLNGPPDADAPQAWEL